MRRTRTAAVVIPVYKPSLEWYEELALKRVREVLGRHPVFFIMPEGADFSYLPAESWRFRRIFLPTQFFDSIDSYNSLMLCAEFYQLFQQYEYILIYQLDAFVFSDQLDYFCSLGYDYIGAPWTFPNGYIPNTCGKGAFLYVGNGGFSLRNTRAFINLLSKHSDWIDEWNGNEDAFFAYYGKYGGCDFKVAPVKVAYRFSWEAFADRWIKKTKGILPFGCHGWVHRNAELYFKVFYAAGCDLSPYLQFMSSREIELKPLICRYAAERRFIASMNGGRKISACLPDNRKWCVYAVDKTGRQVAERLQEEGVSMEKVFSFQPEEIQRLAFMLEENKTQDRLIVQPGDRATCVGLQQYGMVEGREYESFWSYYMVYEERLLRRIMHL